MKLLLSLAVATAVFVLISCNNGVTAKKGDCDSVSITEAILKKALNKDLPDSGLEKIRAFLKGPTLGIYAGPIDPSKATERHMSYLKWAKAIKDPNGDIVHFLWVDKDGLQTLYEYGQEGGVRLYFSNAPGTDSLNIILVPVDNNGENVHYKADGTTALVNKLDPCPDNCINGDYNNDTNSEKDLNYEYHNTLGKRWYKPNKLQAGTRGHWWNVDNSATRD